MSAARNLLTVDGADLIGMLTDLRRTSADDYTMPMIHGVHLHVAHRDGGTEEWRDVPVFTLPGEQGPEVKAA